MKKIYFITLIFTITLIISCKKKQETRVEGYIYLFDRLDSTELWINVADTNAFDLKNMNNHSGIKITFTKDNNTKFETTTNTEGYYFFDNIPEGMYKLVYEKEKHSKLVIDNYIILPGTKENPSQINFNNYNYNYYFLRRIRSKSDTNGYSVTINNNKVYFNGYINNNFIYVYLFSTKKNLTDITAEDYYYSRYSYSYNHSLDLLREYMIFKAGDTLYWRAYSASVGNLYLLNQIFSFFIEDEKTTNKYIRVYGLCPESDVNYIVVPNDFVSKYPENYLPNNTKIIDGFIK